MRKAQEQLTSARKQAAEHEANLEAVRAQVSELEEAKAQV